MVAIARTYEIGMEQFQLVDEIMFNGPVAMHYGHLVAIRQDQFVFASRPGLKSFIGEYGLEQEIVPLLLQHDPLFGLSIFDGAHQCGVELHLVFLG